METAANKIKTFFPDGKWSARCGMFFAFVLGLFAFSVHAENSKDAEKWGDNLLKNPSFEEGTAGWISASWVKDAAKFEVDKSTVCGGGSGSLKIIGEAGKRGSIYQNFKLPEGTKEIMVTGFVKTSDFKIPWTAYILVEVFYKDAKGKTKSKYYKKSSPWNKSEIDWLELKVTGAVPEGATGNARIYLVTASHKGTAKPDNIGTAWFDNISVQTR
jgi:hypothetical protein